MSPVHTPFLKRGNRGIWPQDAVSGHVRMFMHRPVSSAPRLAVAILAAALALFLLVAPVRASGGGIRVLDSRAEINFPDGISFTLAAEGEAEIVEVRLFYRTLEDGIWSYAYSGFNTGRHVTASFRLSIGGSNYLPPGATLEYYYVIRDARGNVHETSPNVIEYTDDRFEWERIQAGPLLLLYHDLRRSKVEAVTRDVEERLDHIFNLLRIETGRPIRGVIYNRPDEAEDAFPRQSRTTDELHLFGGFAFPATGGFVGVGFQTGIIVHEAAHLLLDQALEPNALPLPSWLDEGFASYVAPGATPYSGKSLSSRGLPLRAMTRVSGTPLAITTFYQKAESVLAYLIEEYGVEPFQQFIGELGQGSTTEQALLTAYGFDVNGLEDLWAVDAKRPPAPAPGSPARSSPWVSFSTLLIGGLAAAVALVVVTRLAIRRLRPRVDTGEGLQPWEDPDLLDPNDEDEYRF